MLILAAQPKKGGTACGSSCPFYQPESEVRCYGGVKQSHCRMIMQPYFVDCHIFDVSTLQVIETSDENWKTMLAAIGKRPSKKKRKIYKLHRKPVNKIKQ